MPRPGYLERILAAVGAHGFDDAIRSDLAAWARPVVPGLLREVLSGYALDPEGIHGVGHWLRVRANGLALAARTPGADAVVVELFALLHDCRRRDEDRDIGHGERAADHARHLAREGVLRLDPARLDLLAEACAGHEHGGVSRDPTIGCCWDADRLELSRLGRPPKARFLSTDAAQDPVLQDEAWNRGATDWHDQAGAAAWGAGEVGRAGRPLRHAGARA
jgi:uncharacterized protein